MMTTEMQVNGECDESADKVDDVGELVYERGRRTLLDVTLFTWQSDSSIYLAERAQDEAREQQ